MSKDQRSTANGRGHRQGGGDVGSSGGRSAYNTDRFFCPSFGKSSQDPEPDPRFKTVRSRGEDESEFRPYWTRNAVEDSRCRNPEGGRHAMRQVTDDDFRGDRDLLERIGPMDAGDLAHMADAAELGAGRRVDRIQLTPNPAGDASPMVKIRERRNDDFDINIPKAQKIRKEQAAGGDASTPRPPNIRSEAQSTARRSIRKSNIFTLKNLLILIVVVYLFLLGKQINNKLFRRNTPSLLHRMGQFLWLID